MNDRTEGRTFTVWMVNEGDPLLKEKQKLVEVMRLPCPDLEDLLSSCLCTDDFKLICILPFALE